MQQCSNSFEYTSHSYRLDVNISAYDPDGHLYNYSLHALYGDNQRINFYSKTYGLYLSSGGVGPEWYGIMPSSTFNCSNIPTTCGYTFFIKPIAAKALIFPGRVIQVPGRIYLKN